jgi:ribosome-associated heat shock protein Hsp15
LSGAPVTQRADQWLFFSRLVKSRTLAAALIHDGALRVNGAICEKPAHSLKSGDVLTLRHGPYVRVLTVLGAAARRGPAAEAQALYRDDTPPREPKEAAPAHAAREPGSGRPTKRDRRDLDKWNEGDA